MRARANRPPRAGSVITAGYSGLNRFTFETEVARRVEDQNLLQFGHDSR